MSKISYHVVLIYYGRKNIPRTNLRYTILLYLLKPIYIQSALITKIQLFLWDGFFLISWRYKAKTYKPIKIIVIAIIFIIIITTIIFHPQTVKTRFIVGEYTNTMDVVTKTYKSGGVWAFFKGFWPSTLSIFLFAGIDLMTYEHIKENYSHFHEKYDYPKWIVSFYSAVISNAVGVVMCYPISTIITRLQVDDGQSLTIILY